MEELVAAEDVDVEGIITGIAVLIDSMMMITLMIDTIALMNDNMNAIHVNVSMKMKLDIELLKESFHMHTPVVYMNNCAQRYGCSQSYHMLSSETVSLQSKRRVTNNTFNNIHNAKQ